MAVLLRAAALGVRCWVNDDAGIDRHCPQLVNNDRVDVHFAQLRQFADHFRHPQQHLLQRMLVHRARAAPFAQRFGDP